MLYTPSVGFCLLLAAAAQRAVAHAKGRPRARRAVHALALALVAAYFARSVERNRVWRDKRSLYCSALDVVPGQITSYTECAREIPWRRADDSIDRAAYAEKVALLERAAAFPTHAAHFDKEHPLHGHLPDYWLCHEKSAMGLALKQELGQREEGAALEEEAVVHCLRALRLANPLYPQRRGDSLAELAVVLYNLGRRKDAFERAKAAFAATPSGVAWARPIFEALAADLQRQLETKRRKDPPDSEGELRALQDSIPIAVALESWGSRPRRAVREALQRAAELLEGLGRRAEADAHLRRADGYL